MLTKGFLERFKISKNPYTCYIWEHFLLYLVAAGVYHACEKWKNPFDSLTSLILGTLCLHSKTRTFFLPAALIYFFTKTLLKFPNLANHSNLYLYLLGFILGVHLCKFMRINFSYQKVKNSIILSLFVVYLMATVHKFNSGFFYADTNCAVWYFEKLHYLIFRSHIELPQFFKIISPYMAIAIEGVTSIFLITKNKYKLIGLGFGLFLHFLLGVGGFADFASLCLGVYFLTAPSKSLYFKSSFFGMNATQVFLLSSLFSGGMTGVFFKLMTYGHEVLPYSHVRVTQGIVLIFGSYFLAKQILVSLKLFFFKGNFSFKKITFIDFKKSYIFVWGFLFVFSLFPYLGLRNLGTFAMFSNLKNIGGVNNHFFIPQFDVFPFLKDKIDIQRMSYPQILKKSFHNYVYSKEGLKIFLYKERLDLEHMNSPLKVVYFENGKRFESSNLWQDPKFKVEKSPWYWTFLHIKGQDRNENNLCIR
ncbi:hypothetical protein N9O57_00485 [bacterium]|nr:hypothetical protein [bacterium]